MRAKTSSSKFSSPAQRGRRFVRSTNRRGGVALAALAFVAFSTAALADWQQQAAPGDLQRLSRLTEARAKALDESRRGPGTGDQSAIAGVMNVSPQRASAQAYVGNWRCRTVKLGGISAYVVYGWFNCRISQRDGELFLEKLNGSQRTRGYLYEDNGAFVYLGASSVADEPPHRYSGNGASVGGTATPDDQIGILTMIGAGHARLEMPFPVQESTLDVLELKR